MYKKDPDFWLRRITYIVGGVVCVVIWVLFGGEYAVFLAIGIMFVVFLVTLIRYGANKS